MSPGLIMKITGVNDLGVIYAGDAWNDGNLRTLGSYTTMEGREALAHFLRLARALGCSSGSTSTSSPTSASGWVSWARCG